MAGTHRERIEVLEVRFDQLETGLAEMGDHVTEIDRTMDKMTKNVREVNVLLSRKR